MIFCLCLFFALLLEKEIADFTFAHFGTVSWSNISTIWHFPENSSALACHAFLLYFGQFGMIDSPIKFWDLNPNYSSIVYPSSSPRPSFLGPGLSCKIFMNGSWNKFEEAAVAVCLFCSGLLLLLLHNLGQIPTHTPLLLPLFLSPCLSYLFVLYLTFSISNLPSSTFNNCYSHTIS